MSDRMNAVLLLEHLGVLQKVRWVSKEGRRVQVTQRRGDVLTVRVELPFCKTWIFDRPWTLLEFLEAHKLVR
jgi:hypothetical protein